jgi:uncharacterized protein YdgA (DUF945 family)
MKKLGAILAIVVVILVVGLPPVLGMLTESQVNARVDALAGNPFVSARVDSFERGWFSSRTNIQLALSESYIAQLERMNTLSGNPAAAPAALTRGTTILVDLVHGPIAVRDGVHFGLSKMVARLDPQTEGYAELLQRLGIPYLFEFRGRTGFAGAVKFDADAPPIDFVADDARVRFSGAVLDGSFAGGSVQYNGRIDTLEVTSGPSAFSLQSISATGDNELRSSYLVLGTIELRIARATMLDATVSTGPVFEASNLHFSSDFALDDEGTLANGQATYAAESIVAGPDMQIRDASVGLILRNLDAEALEAYAAAMQRGAAAVLPDSNQLLADITPAVERLLAAGPSMAIDPIRFTLNDELFDARIQLNTKTGALPPAGALDLRDPALWFLLLDGTATANVSKNLARNLAVQAMTLQFAANQELPPDQAQYMAEAQAGLILITLVQQGILNENGDNYSTELGFTDGALSVNGSPFGLP